MIQLIYISEAVRPFDDAELQQLLAQARENNTRLGLTGMLVYHEGSFMQVLEGEPTAVNALYDRIEPDPRHTHVTKLLTTTIHERSFGDWRMGFFNADAQDTHSLPGFADFFGEQFSRYIFAARPSLARELLMAFRAGQWRQHVSDRNDVVAPGAR